MMKMLKEAAITGWIAAETTAEAMAEHVEDAEGVVGVNSERLPTPWSRLSITLA